MVNNRELLGAATPLPILVEEVLRYRMGLTVSSKRFKQFIKVIASDMPAELPLTIEWQDDTRSLLSAAAILFHDLPPLTIPAAGDEIAELCYAVTAFFRPDVSGWYQEWLQTHSEISTDPLTLPSPVLLLVFIHGLYHQWLNEADFQHCVLHGKVLSTAISPHRPLRHLNRFLDYLGISHQPFFACLYRQLSAQIWPTACAENWLQWEWVTQPGDTDLFSSALTKIAEGDFSLPRLYELKYSPLPAANWLDANIPLLPAVIQLLLPLLRGDKSFPTESNRALIFHWLRKSNLQATQQAYSTPNWWEYLITNDFPQLKVLLNELNSVSLPAESLPRSAWLEKYLITDYQKICANLLLPGVASGEEISDVMKLASDGDIPAIHALALTPTIAEAPLTLLRKIMTSATISMAQAAQRALNHLAHRLGLPNEKELYHQQLLNEAWNISALDGDRVRVGWRTGGYRIRIALHRGQVLIDVIGPRGTMASIPPAVRQSDAYQQAREAQREAQRQYRIFRDFLEQAMLTQQPIMSGEFLTLLANPIFSHLAERLIFHTADGRVFIWNASDIWETIDGEPVSLSGVDTMTICITHPIFLSQNKILCAWQSLAADRRLIQPFKQLFREIYCCDDDDTLCRRFAGRKIDPLRAYALLRAAGFSPASGTARREWPGGYCAHICWAEGVNGRELFGNHRLPVVVCGKISFYYQGKLISPNEANPIMISETLRAADLLTTRAAIGDAELTSNETVLLRATLLRELARSLSLTNLLVREQGRFAIVLGKRATYRINLSNGIIMLEPEGRQIEAPRHEELWQPAEDNDTTSTIISIILTLAMDELIGDLTFLAQLS